MNTPPPRCVECGEPANIWTEDGCDCPLCHQCWWDHRHVGRCPVRPVERGQLVLVTA